jgi:hypothetical protein
MNEDLPDDHKCEDGDSKTDQSEAWRYWHTMHEVQIFIYYDLEQACKWHRSFSRPLRCVA